MNWFNFDMMVLRSEPFITASLEQRGAWLCLVGYCLNQENDGQILHCQKWTDMHWIQACGVPEKVVKEASPLWFWNGDSLRPYAYPIGHQHQAQADRKNGQKGARKRWEAKMKFMEEVPDKIIRKSFNDKASHSPPIGPANA